MKLPERKYEPKHNDELREYAMGWNSTIENTEYLCNKYGDEQTLKDYHITLQEYDDIILERLNYTVKIDPWLKEGISQEAMNHARIGFYPGGD